jgi:methionyl-tRNA synthetase
LRKLKKEEIEKIKRIVTKPESFESMLKRVDVEDFKKLDIRIGEIREVEEIEGSNKLYVLKVDVGERLLRVVAGIKKHYSKEELLGKKVAVIVNLKKREIRGVVSEGMVIAADDGKNLALLTVDRDIEKGAKCY